MRSTAPWIMLAVTTIVTGLTFLPIGDHARSAIVIVLSAAAAICAVIASRRAIDGLNRAWLIIATGMALNTGGDIWYQYLLRSSQELPDLSGADALYLLSYPFLFAGLGCMAWMLSGARRKSMLADSSAIVVVAGLVIWQFFVVNPGLLADDSLLQGVVFAAYPMSDILLIGAMVGLLFSAIRPTGSLILLVTFTAMFLGADIFYILMDLTGMQSQTVLSDALYCAAYGLLGAAALHPSVARPVADRRADAETSYLRLALLSGTVFAALALAVLVPALGYDYQPVVYLAVALAVAGLVTGRIVSLVRKLVSEHRRLTDAETKLMHQAEHDSLTELPNRAKLLRHISDEMAAVHDQHQTLYLMFVDLDNFKFVNDSYGHRAGDELLYQASGRIREAVRADNFVARIGGDEFVVVARTDGDVHVIADRIIDALSQPFILHDLSATVGASIGIAELGDHIESGALLRDADLALYRAKGDGGGCARVFDTTMRAWAEERLNIEAGVREALTNGGLTVAYQPRIDLASGQMTSVEALLRWPQEPAVPVSRIIEVAEASGLISAVGRFVLHRACHDIAELNRARASAGPISVAVNVSMLQLSQHDLEADTRESLVASGLDPVLLTLELTETFLAEDPTAAKRTLDELSALGVRLEIDDFGTGYSSLARLAHFPLHGLKIDRSFITSVEEDATARSLVESIVTLARALDLEVTAEGIETTLQANVVKAVGCDLGQGFLYARPMSLDNLREFVPERSEHPVPAPS
jgi:diguanylate cyclase (GGDEF)-like protein